jgi:hypothetical protein
VDGSGDIDLLKNQTESRDINIEGEAAKRPLATRDVDGDGALEIVYTTTSSPKPLKYVDNVTGTPTTKSVKTANGANVTASPTRGAA